MFSFHTCKMAYRFYFFMVYIPTLSTDFIYISFGVVCRGMHFFFCSFFSDVVFGLGTELVESSGGSKKNGGARRISKTARSNRPSSATVS